MPNLRALAPPAVAVLLGVSACAPTRRIPEGALLLNANHLELLDDQPVDREALTEIIKQKPNKRLLGYRFYLQAWNAPDPERIARERPRREAEQDARNAERVARGKSARPYRNSFHEWLRDAVGEPPVLMDTSLTERSRRQLELYLHKEGWFDAVVTDTVVRHRERMFGGRPGRAYRQPKVRVIYRVAAGEPSFIRNYASRVDDPVMQAMLRADTLDGHVHPGDRFSAEAIDAERTHTADLFKEEGYLYFTRDLVMFDADTMKARHRVDLMRSIERPGPRSKSGLAGTPQGTVQRIRSVTVNMARTQPGWIAAPPDTLDLGGYRFLYSGRKPEFKPEALLRTLLLQPGELYTLSRNDRTYRRLTNLRVFDRVDITYDSTRTGAPGLVDAYIDLVPGNRQSVGFEPFLTNRGGVLGTSLSLSYRHRNLFRSMTSMEARIVFGFEAQRSIVEQTEEASTNVGRDVLFNTLEIGPEVTFRLPKALVADRWLFGRSNNARTNITGLFNYQQRPDFTRSLAKGSIGLIWSETLSNRKVWEVYPFEVNVVKIPQISDGFAEYLAATNDPVLTNSYTDHLITGPRMVYTFTDQERRKQRNVFSARTGLDLAGSLPLPLPLPLQWFTPDRSDSTGTYHTVAGIRFAQFIKGDVEGRWYRYIHEKSSLAMRLTCGAGVPFGNLDVLPFESSFYVGGANSLRAWLARSLGPGSYRSDVVTYDRTGEFRLEYNIEYRFDLVGYLEGALFADAGNIWYWKEDPIRPGSGLSKNAISEIAVGSGVGLRFNFDFFIFRLDLGLKMKDPSLPRGQRWILSDREPAYDTRFGQLLNLNLGIGYPF